MSTIIKKLIQFFSFSGSISTDLETYIASKNPKSHADVERLTLQYQSRGICRRIQ
jgi:predicted secreted Zn-dependent protease